MNRVDKAAVRAARGILKTREKELAALRDKLREDRDTLDTLHECCTEAHEEVEAAIESLSRYV